MAGIPSSNPFITLDCTDLIVRDQTGAIAQIVQNTVFPFSVSTDFVFGGSFAPGIVASSVPYTVTYSFESETGGLSGTLGTDSGSTVAGQFNYSSTITLPPNTLPPDLYELSVVITFASLFPMTGFFSDVDLQVF